MKTTTKIVLLIFCLAVAFISPVIAQSNLVDKKFLMGDFNYKQDTSFVKVDDKYCDQTTYLKKQAYQYYKRMYADAKKAGVILNIVSGTRSFTSQKGIWETKWVRKDYLKIKNPEERINAIMEWSSMPGTSRHHWGTDMDLVCIYTEWFDTPLGKKTYDWLVKNAANYHFGQPYTAGRKVGYNEEKWHWSYLPLSKQYLRAFPAKVTDADISGFSGSDLAVQMHVIDKWVLGINPACK